MKFPSLLLLLLFYCSTWSIQAVHPKKAWTIFVYLAADNDLNIYAKPNIEQMMRVGSNDDRNIIIYLAETKANKKYGKLMRVDKDTLIELEHDDNADSGSRDVCLHACRRAFAEYPAEHNALIFWNHGSGCLNMPFADLFKGIAYDERLNTYLTDRDVLAILKELSETVFAGNKLDLLGFDACLMAGLELQRAFAPYVHYYVASEELEDGPGWNYTGALSGITSMSSAQDVAQKLVSAYARTYASHTDRFTLSAVDLAKIYPLAWNVNAIAKELLRLLASPYQQDIMAFLQASTNPAHVTCFDKPEKPDYIDLDHMYANLLVKIATTSHKDDALKAQCQHLRQLLLTGRTLIKQAVIANATGPQHPHAAGICIYWAQEIIHPSYTSLAWTQRYPQWEMLMHEFLIHSLSA